MYFDVYTGDLPANIDRFNLVTKNELTHYAFLFHQEQPPTLARDNLLIIDWRETSETYLAMSLEALGVTIKFH